MKVTLLKHLPFNTNATLTSSTVKLSLRESRTAKITAHDRHKCCPIIIRVATNNHKKSIVMFERKSLLSLLVGVTLCISLWHIMLQQQPQAQFFEPTLSLSTVNDSAVPLLPLVTTTVGLDRLPKNDYSQLIDLEEFEFTINHRGCKDSEQTVILVHSAPGNADKRAVIRDTWGSKDKRSLILFVIGAVNATNAQEKLDEENRKHGDLLQGNFEDAYRNMTYKHVSVLKWFVYNCPNARFLLKTDDDVFVNTPLLYDYLETPSEPSRQFHHGRLMMCSEVASAKVKRTFRSKWRVSYDEYLDKYFPNHCPGYAILYSADVVLQLYQKAQSLPYFWIDDVHITGTVASKLNISIAPTNGLFLNPAQQNDLLNLRVSPEKLKFFLARPNLGEPEIRFFWSLVTNRKAEEILSHNTINRDVSSDDSKVH